MAHQRRPARQTEHRPGAPDTGGGAVAQLGERRLCKAEVGGSNPPGSTSAEPTPPGDPGRGSARRRREARPTTTPAGRAARASRDRGVPRGERSAPRPAPSQRKSARAQESYTNTQLEYDGERETAGPASKPIGVTSRGGDAGLAAQRSRECLTKGQATEGARRMPRRHGPMKDVARLRKAPVSCLASSPGDLRMGQPGPLHSGSRPAEHIGRIEGTGGTETSQYPEEQTPFP